MGQDWNSLIRYVKRKVGSPLAQFELTDDDIFDIVTDSVLPAVSQYIGYPVWLRVTSSDKVAEDSAKHGIYPPHTFRLPVSTDLTIVDVYEVFYHRDDVGIVGMYKNMIGVLDPRDTVMTNTFQDMLESLSTVQTFQWIPPDKLSFDESVHGHNFICQCKATHKNLSTIPSDVFIDFVKPLTLAEVYEDLVEIRSKYRQLNTPFGAVELNWERLEQKAQELRREVQEKFDSLPPDQLVHIF